MSFSADSTPRLVIGSAGGGTIPAIVLEVITSVLDHQKCIRDAVAAPRFVNENRRTGSSSHTRYEREVQFRLPDDLVNDLSGRGQTMLLIDGLNFGAAQGILVDPVTGALTRGTDPRRGGEF